MSNPGEVFTIEHLSTSYDSFAAGAVLAARRVSMLPGGVHVGLEKVRVRFGPWPRFTAGRSSPEL